MGAVASSHQCLVCSINTTRGAVLDYTFTMAKSNRQHQSDTLVQEKVRTQKPKMYKVVLLNDDFTTMEFVVHVLETIFLKSPSEAMQIMLHVHKSGKGVAGIFSKQIAEAKIDQVHQRARNEDFPLRCAMEEA